jgi:hypothetical protein
MPREPTPAALRALFLLIPAALAAYAAATISAYGHL